MDLIPELIPPRAPFLLSNNVPDGLRDIAQSISSNLTAMQSEALQAAQALALFDLCNDQLALFRHEMASQAPDQNGIYQDPLWSDWSVLAARAGALSLRNYGQALAAAHSLVGQIPTWLAVVDRNALKAARKRFAASFPAIDKLRHSIAHPEIYANPEKNVPVTGTISLPAAEGFITFGEGGTGTISIQTAIAGRHFSATFDGELVSYEISKRSIIELIEITRTFFQAFSALDLRGSAQRG